MEYVLVLVTVPDAGEGARIGKTLVEERLAACVNVLPGMRSIYRWAGKVEDDAEALMLIKTRRELFRELAARVKTLHEYSVPEVIALPIVEGLSTYLDWVRESTG